MTQQIINIGTNPGDNTGDLHRNAFIKTNDNFNELYSGVILVPLQANTNFYVSTTGSNSNDGSSGSPWLTIQYALDWISNNIHINGYLVTVNIADGTYAEPLIVPKFVGTKGDMHVQLLGNTTTPSNVLLSPTIGDAIFVGASEIAISGMKLQTDVTNGGTCLKVFSGMAVVNGPCEFGATKLYNFYADLSGTIFITANITMLGNASVAFLVLHGCVLSFSGSNITFSGSPVYSSVTSLIRGGRIAKGSGTTSGTHTGDNLVENGGYASTTSLISSNTWTVATSGRIN